MPEHNQAKCMFYWKWYISTYIYRNIFHVNQFSLVPILDICGKILSNWSRSAFSRKEPSHYLNKTNLRDLIAATGLVIFIKLDSNHRLISPCDLEIWWMPRKTKRHLLYTPSSFVHHLKSIGEFKLELQSGNAQFRSKLAICLSHVTLKFNGSPCKIIGHLSYTTSSFLQHFKTIGIIKLELQSGSAQFGSKLAIICPAWPRKLTDDLEKQNGTFPMLLQALRIISNPSVKSKLSYSPETRNSGQNWRLFVPSDLDIWWITLKNNRAPLLYYI